MDFRKTRSNKSFSPWQTCLIENANPDFDLEKLLQEKVKTENEFPDGILEDDAIFEDEEELSSIPPPPPTTLKPSTGTSTLADNGDLEEPPTNTRKRRRNASSHASRSRKRAEPEFGTTNPRKSIRERYEDGGTAVECKLTIEDIKVTSTGYVGLRDKDGGTEVHDLEYFVGKKSQLKFTLQEWDGKAPMALVDRKRRLVGILAGQPDSEDWPAAREEATKALESARKRLEAHATDAGRRGGFTSIRCGVSHGGGQKKPGNLHNDALTTKVLQELNGLKAFQRVSSFSTSVMATRTPDLYQYYAEKMGQLYHHEEHLRRPFPRSIQSGTTYNLGPQTVCLKHLDYGNLAGGMCAITPYGKFDYRTGGHLVLWECRLVIQFPPGSTILIPSAIISHSNTAIGAHETRYSFTQYTAGALFRWVDNEFQKATDYRGSLSAEGLKRVKEADAVRWKDALSLLPIIPKKKIQ